MGEAWGDLRGEGKKSRGENTFKRRNDTGRLFLINAVNKSKFSKDYEATPAVGKHNLTR